MRTHVEPAATASYVLVACPTGFYGLLGEVCLPCPMGAWCEGVQYEPLPLYGFTRISRSVFVSCVPSEACYAITIDMFNREAQRYDNCNTGYGGLQCRKCVEGYYRKAVACVMCPRDSLAYIILFFVLLVVVGALAGWLHKKQYNLKGLTIGVDLLQTLSMFNSFSFGWPGALQAVRESVNSVICGRCSAGCERCSPLAVRVARIVQRMSGCVS